MKENIKETSAIKDKCLNNDEDSSSEIYNLTNINNKLENDLLKLTIDISSIKEKILYYNKQSKLIEDSNETIKIKINNITKPLEKNINNKERNLVDKINNINLKLNKFLNYFNNNLIKSEENYKLNESSILDNAINNLNISNQLNCSTDFIKSKTLEAKSKENNNIELESEKEFYNKLSNMTFISNAIEDNENFIKVIKI